LPLVDIPVSIPNNVVVGDRPATYVARVSNREIKKQEHHARRKAMLVPQGGQRPTVESPSYSDSSSSSSQHSSPRLPPKAPNNFRMRGRATNLASGDSTPARQTVQFQHQSLSPQGRSYNNRK